MESTPNVNEAPAVIAFLRVMRARWPIVLACLLIGAAIGFIYSNTQQRKYSATATLYFRDPQIDETLFGNQAFAPVTDPSIEQATDQKLVQEPAVTAAAAKLLPGMTGTEVKNEVSIQPNGSSDLVNIIATNPSPAKAAQIANAMANGFVSYRQQQDRSQILAAQKLVKAEYAALPPSQRSTALGTSLLQRSQDLQVLAAVQTGNAEVSQPAAAPTSPSVPRTSRNIAIGLVLGAFIGVLLALLRSRLDTRLHSVDEATAFTRRPLLTVVPESRALGGQGVLQDLPPPVAETFRSLRASLRYFNSGGPIRSLLVMSPQASEGKSTVAWYLACAAAEVGTSTLLIEADLRRPGLRRRLPGANGNIPAGVGGLSGVISGQLSLEDAVDQVDPERAPFSLLASGPVPPNPTDLLASDAMSRLLVRAQEMYELVIVDSPPVLVVADTVPLLQQVSGVLLVLRLGVTDKRRLRTLLTMTENLQASVLGHVVNGVSGRSGDYGGYYSYYDSPPPPTPAPSGLAPQSHA